VEIELHVNSRTNRNIFYNLLRDERSRPGTNDDLEKFVRSLPEVSSIKRQNPWPAPAGADHVIYFHSEQDKTLFLLKWS